MRIENGLYLFLDGDELPVLPEGMTDEAPRHLRALVMGSKYRHWTQPRTGLPLPRGFCIAEARRLRIATSEVHTGTFPIVARLCKTPTFLVFLHILASVSMALNLYQRKPSSFVQCRTGDSAPNLIGICGSVLSHPIGMRLRDLTHKQKTSVPCPMCGALVGRRCLLQAGGLRSEPHTERKFAAAESIEQKKSPSKPTRRGI